MPLPLLMVSAPAPPVSVSLPAPLRIVIAVARAPAFTVTSPVAEVASTLVSNAVSEFVPKVTLCVPAPAASSTRFGMLLTFWNLRSVTAPAPVARSVS